MQIEHRGNNELTITGNIKSLEDSTEIKNVLSSLQKRGAKSITIRILDSFSMTSTVIGYLMKLVNLDRIVITLIVGDQRLFQLFEELSLVQSFNARLIGN